MPLISDIRGMPVAGPKGRFLGTVTEVLFHPSEPRAVGLQVRPRALLGVLPRSLRYLPLGRVAAWGNEAVASVGTLPSAREGEREIGAAWDRTVIWRRMPALTRSGAAAGRVADAGFTMRSGTVTRVLLSEGAVSDAALGLREVPGDLVAGFDPDAPGGGAVRIDDAALTAPASGGSARAAGEAAGAATQAAAGAVREVGIKAAAAGMAAAKMVSVSKAGRATGRAARRAWKSVRATLAEALAPEDEE